jgi:molecular chaperone GrpE
LPGTPAPNPQELAEAKDRVLRTLAEMENLRQRTAREIADARQYAVANFAREMVAVSDNLRRAIEAVPAETRAAGDKALAALIEGVEVTERGLDQALTKFGVRRIEAKGQKFDPSVHQAMIEVDSDEVAAGAVAQEIQPGYVIGDRVLRPALVAVAKKLRPAAGNGGGSGKAAADEGEAPAAANDPAADAAPTSADQNG